MRPVNPSPGQRCERRRRRRRYSPRPHRRNRKVPNGRHGRRRKRHVIRKTMRSAMSNGLLDRRAQRRHEPLLPQTRAQNPRQAVPRRRRNQRRRASAERPVRLPTPGRGPRRIANRVPSVSRPARRHRHGRLSATIVKVNASAVRRRSKAVHGAQTPRCHALLLRPADRTHLNLQRSRQRTRPNRKQGPRVPRRAARNTHHHARRADRSVSAETGTIRKAHAWRRFRPPPTLCYVHGCFFLQYAHGRSLLRRARRTLSRN
jgi:hypothetical protein